VEPCFCILLAACGSSGSGAAKTDAGHGGATASGGTAGDRADSSVGTGGTTSSGGTTGSGGTGGTIDQGLCTGRGWRDTCDWLSTCSGGRFELVCSTNRGDTEALLADAGIVLDGSTCACIVDNSMVHAVPYDNSFCSDQFQSTDPNRLDSAEALANAMCGWTR
jgi:hypothetical protein